MKHVVFIAIVMVLGVGAGVMVMHDRKGGEDEPVVADAAARPVAVVRPDAAMVPVPPPPPIQDAAADDEVVVTATADAAECDEVSCVLDNYEGACCAQFRRPSHPAPPPPGDDEALDREMIQAGVERVKPQILGCSKRHPADGMVKVSVRVAPNGKPTSVEVKQTPDAALGECVARIMKTATFQKTREGGAFSYPFMFAR
jgi:hypothetical protein